MILQYTVRITVEFKCCGYLRLRSSNSNFVKKKITDLKYYGLFYVTCSAVKFEQRANVRSGVPDLSNRRGVELKSLSVSRLPRFKP